MCRVRMEFEKSAWVTYIQHIKCAKYNPAFSKCDTCKIYCTKMKKQISEAQRELLDKNISNMWTSSCWRRKSTVLLKQICCQSTKCICIIMDEIAMDHWKTHVPFFTNPQFMGIALPSYCTEQVKHDSNLCIKVLWHMLHKYEQEKGVLMPKLFIQLNNGPDQNLK